MYQGIADDFDEYFFDVHKCAIQEPSDAIFAVSRHLLFGSIRPVSNVALSARARLKPLIAVFQSCDGRSDVSKHTCREFQRVLFHPPVCAMQPSGHEGVLNTSFVKVRTSIRTGISRGYTLELNIYLSCRPSFA